MPGDKCRQSYVSNVIAVVVTYYPEHGQFTRLLQVLSSQVLHTIVVNNGPPIQIPSSDITKASLIEPGCNIGIAAAINRGIEAAEQAGASYVLLLDQDSLPDNDMVSCLLAAHRQLSIHHGRPVAAVGPAVIDQESGRGTPFVGAVSTSFGEGFVVYPVEHLLSSGSLIELGSYRKIGPMDEGLFIDLVDTEWYLRAASIGCQAYGVPSARLYHQLGKGVVTFWCGRWRHFPRHGAFRYYYMARNRMLLLVRGYIPLHRRLKELLVLLYILIAGFVLLPQRWGRLKMVARGIVAGVQGRDGKAPFASGSAA